MGCGTILNGILVLCAAAFGYVFLSRKQLKELKKVREDLKREIAINRRAIETLKRLRGGRYE